MDVFNQLNWHALTLISVVLVSGLLLLFLLIKKSRGESMSVILGPIFHPDDVDYIFYRSELHIFFSKPIGVIPQCLYCSYWNSTFEVVYINRSGVAASRPLGPPVVLVAQGRIDYIDKAFFVQSVEGEIQGDVILVDLIRSRSIFEQLRPSHLTAAHGPTTLSRDEYIARHLSGLSRALKKDA